MEALNIQLNKNFIIDPRIPENEKKLKDAFVDYFTTVCGTSLTEEKTRETRSNYIFDKYRTLWTVSKERISLCFRANSICFQVPKESGDLCKCLAKTPSLQYKRPLVELVNAVTSKSFTELTFAPYLSQPFMSAEQATFEKNCKKYLVGLGIDRESIPASIKFLWDLQKTTYSPECPKGATIKTSHNPARFIRFIIGSRSNAEVFLDKIKEGPIDPKCAISYVGIGMKDNNYVFQFGPTTLIEDCLEEISKALLRCLFPAEPVLNRIRVIDETQIAIRFFGLPNIEACKKAFEPILRNYSPMITFTGANEVEESDTVFTDFVFNLIVGDPRLNPSKHTIPQA